MVRTFLWLYALCILGCGDWHSEPAAGEFLLLPPPNKLEQLLRLPKDTVLDYYDLSGDLIKKQPDLSDYTIRSLNLSWNMLDSLDPDLLPQGLEKLDLSYNAYMNFLHDSIQRIKELNLSHNLLRRFGLIYFIDRVDVSYNNLSWLCLFWTYDRFKKYCSFRSDHERGKMPYLNMSHNPYLTHKVAFEPSKVDTIIRNDIADTLELVEIRKQMRWEMNHLKGLW